MKIKVFPLLPVRDIIIFPHMIAPLAAGRRRSVNAIKKAMDTGHKLVIVAQKDIHNEYPQFDDIYKIGVITKVVQVLTLPDGSWRILIEGNERVRIKQFYDTNDFLEVEIERIKNKKLLISSTHIKAIMRSISEIFNEYVSLNPLIDPGIITIIKDIENIDELTDFIAGHLKLKKEKSQKLLEEFNPIKRAENIIFIIRKENEILKIKHEIEGRVSDQITKSQKEYILSEQMKAIKNELHGKDAQADEIKEFSQNIKKSGMSAEGTKQAKKEVERLKKMMPFSPEATVVRSYLEWLIKLPWNKKTKDKINLDHARKILEKEHYGLSEAKERILEYLAVSKLSKKLKTPILCFVGPPGTGKTSFGRSIAHSLGRKFIRVSLGGIRDEAEIRGHRRTYIGSMPGRIIQSIVKSGTANPVFVLDEVDKMGKDFRGDPSSALLEALDPEQNKDFSDHYLEIAFDLSDVMFITTANTTATIPPALIDRMEIIKFTGYTREEKLNISQKFLIPKQISDNGLKGRKIHFNPSGINLIIGTYTREAGVRNLDREIAKVLRKVAAAVAGGNKKAINLTKGIITKYLGIPRYSYSRASLNDIGVAAGLSWTPNGGESLSIEVSLMPGEGKLSLTGALGDIMKESAQTALSYVRGNTKTLGVSPDFYKKNDIHIHVPAGAVPKEGPSAGITICTALLSKLKNKPVKKDIVMTGEITLSGRILEIGGFKEKILAAHRDGFSTVIFPAENAKNIKEIPQNIKKSLNLIAVDDFKEAIGYIF